MSSVDSYTIELLRTTAGSAVGWARDLDLFGIAGKLRRWQAGRSDEFLMVMKRVCRATGH
ncbi:MAG TPA: hypothetical protein PK225_05145 [Azonexus sp.]|jgi:hypothetical protein|nr:hypothetical protein [Azonexus sp.]